jgi:hypothetical protein
LIQIIKIYSIIIQIRRLKSHARRGEEGERVLNKHNLIGAGRRGMTVRIYTMYVFFILAMWFISLSARISSYNLRRMAFYVGKRNKNSFGLVAPFVKLTKNIIYTPCFILFYFILFYFILFYFILF